MSPMAMMMASLAQNPNNYRYATCNFNDTWSQVRGRMDLRQFVSIVKRLTLLIKIQGKIFGQAVPYILEKEGFILVFWDKYHP
jgi:hypothetical protein